MHPLLVLLRALGTKALWSKVGTGINTAGTGLFAYSMLRDLFGGGGGPGPQGPQQQADDGQEQARMQMEQMLEAQHRSRVRQSIPDYVRPGQGGY